MSSISVRRLEVDLDMDFILQESELAFVPEGKRGTVQASLAAQLEELEDVDRLIRNYGAQVSRFLAFSLNDSDVAATLTQDCFLRAWRSRHQFRGDCSVSTWLTRIACNLVRDHTGSGKIRFWRQANATALDLAEVSDYVPSDQISAESLLLARERLGHVWNAVAKLSPRQRSIFLLRFVEEMEIHEIAEAIEMPIGTVKSHLHRALTAVRSAEGVAR